MTANASYVRWVKDGPEQYSGYVLSDRGERRIFEIYKTTRGGKRITKLSRVRDGNFVSAEVCKDTLHAKAYANELARLAHFLPVK